MMFPERSVASTKPVLELVEPRSPRAGEIWRALERGARPPYFLTWSWMENWLACLPRDEAPPLAVLLDRDGPLAAFFLGRRRVVRHRVLRSRALFLNATGVPRRDELTLEYNAVLCAPGAHPSLAELLDALPGEWDELFLPAASRGDFPGSALGEPLPRHVVRIDREASTHFVDLARVRAARGGYLDLVSSRTRKQLRRAERDFGGLELEEAADLRQAVGIYEELVALHTRSWRARGLAGAFADPWVDGFHRRLIAGRFDHGEIQLLRVRARGATIGCLYGLVAAGRVLCYQTGFESFVDPHLKAGYACHAEAVRHNAAAGHAVYDLLAGDTRYKRSLGTDEAPLVWARIQRPLARFRIEERLRRWKRAARGAAAPGEAAPDEDRL